MSEVAGRLSIEAAGSALKRSAGGRGILLGGVPGVVPARVVVIGGDVVGTHAARMAAGLGAEVTILDRSLPRLRELDELFQGRVRTRFPTTEAIEQEVFAADAVIGAVLVPGASAPRLVTRGMLKSMQPGSVLVDVAIGGAKAASKPPIRPPMTIRPMWSTASSTIALPTCRVRFPSPRAMRSTTRRCRSVLRSQSLVLPR